MIVLAMALAAAAVALFIPPGIHQRRRRRSWRTPSTRWIFGACGLVIGLAWGGWFGVVVGVALAVSGPLLLGRLESRSQRRSREALERQAPACCDLLAACLSAGSSTADAARAVADALGEPIATALRRMVSAQELGSDPLSAWSSLAEHAALRPIARAAARSAETGAPLAGLLSAVAEDQRDAHRARAEAAARAAGVKSVAPLAACFLPAFLLVGIVPVVASLATPLLASPPAQSWERARTMAITKADEATKTTAATPSATTAMLPMRSTGSSTVMADSLGDAEGAAFSRAGFVRAG